MFAAARVPALLVLLVLPSALLLASVEADGPAVTKMPMKTIKYGEPAAPPLGAAATCPIAAPLNPAVRNPFAGVHAGEPSEYAASAASAASAARSGPTHMTEATPHDVPIPPPV